MPRVMLLGKLPLAGSYVPPPGRLLQPGLYGVRRAGLGLSTAEVCNDPATLFMQTLAAGFSGAASSGCRTGTGGQAQDAGWCAASTAVGQANTTMSTVCTQARNADSAAGDPTESENLQAQLEIERLRAQTQIGSGAYGGAAQRTNYTPYIIGGLVLVGVVGLAVALKKR